MMMTLNTKMISKTCFLIRVSNRKYCLRGMTRMRKNVTSVGRSAWGEKSKRKKLKVMTTITCLLWRLWCTWQMRLGIILRKFFKTQSNWTPKRRHFISLCSVSPGRIKSTGLKTSQGWKSSSLSTWAWSLIRMRRLSPTFSLASCFNQASWNISNLSSFKLKP